MIGTASAVDMVDMVNIWYPSLETFSSKLVGTFSSFFVHFFIVFWVPFLVLFIFFAFFIEAFGIIQYRNFSKVQLIGCWPTCLCPRGWK